MLLSDAAEVLGQAFAKYAIDENWSDLSQCFTESARVTPQLLKDSLEWQTLLVRLLQAFKEETGVEAVELSPPVSYDVYNDVCRDNDYGPQPILKVGQCALTDEEGQGPFIEINFLPDEESGFDNCYRCILTIVDGDQPKVSGFEVELILD